MKTMYRLKKKSGASLVVRHQTSPPTRLLLVGLGVVLLLAAMVLIYDYGLGQAGFERAAAAQRQQELSDEIDRARRENQELRDALARAERAVQMNQVSYEELNRSLGESEKQLTKLREELTFYRNILSPENKISGPQIYSLSIERGAGPGEFRYRVVLVQALKHDKPVTGHLVLDVSGQQDGKPLSLRHPGGQERAIAVHFRYFHDAEGVMRLPTTFRPERVQATVTVTGAAPITVSQSFDWPKF